MMRLSFRGGSRDFTKGKKRGKSAASPSGAGYTTLKEVLAGGLWVRCGTAVGRSRLGPCSSAIPSHFTRANPFETRCGFHRSFLLGSFVSVLLIRLHGHAFQVQGACQIPPVQPPRFLLVAGSPESRRASTRESVPGRNTESRPHGTRYQSLCKPRSSTGKPSLG